MNNLLNWFTPEMFCRGAHAVDFNGDKVSPLSPHAAKYDLYGAICWEFPSNLEERDKAIKKIKRTFQISFPEIWEDNKNMDYYREDGKVIWIDPPLYRLSDSLSENELKKLLALI